VDKETRTRIEKATQRARKVLELDFADQLEGTYDVLASGHIAPSGGSHLTARQRLLREKIIAAVEHKKAAGMKPAEAVADYLRDTAFTALNRFVALKMLEARDLVQECISKGDQSSGYREFCGLAPGVALLPNGAGYRLYLECIFDELSTEVKVLFDRRDVASVLWPSRLALDQLLEVFNAPVLAGFWREDETIGWIYQYFNSPEERRAMREESPAPSNSRELAVRNQFFTPRYVVQFLTDNTLGRLWYEMRQGDTVLRDRCEYLVRRPGRASLRGNLQVPEQAQPLEDAPLCSPQRSRKDPRDLKILDPACGSGHFLLYAFDLLLAIYQEAWADETSPKCEVTGRSLHEDYPNLQTLVTEIPRLILRHNLHGIDIDLRCTQIAAFALWMRAQRAYGEFSVARHTRVPITRTNIVVAEPMPGEEKLRKKFTASLDRPLGQLVTRVFANMELAGEAGSLLKIEDEIRLAVHEVFGGHGELFLPADEERWHAAEEELLEFLPRYAKSAQNNRVYRRRLFADDAVRGFAFIELCRQRYDVILMNPPFGERPKSCEALFRKSYPLTLPDLYAMFFERAFSLLEDWGKIGVISNRTWLGLPVFEPLRTRVLGDAGVVEAAADLGSFVLEAQVETAAVVIGAGTDILYPALWIRLLKTKAKQMALLDALANLRQGKRHKALNITSHSRLMDMPGSVFGYWMSNQLAAKYRAECSVGVRAATVRQGTATADDFRFLRLAWEIPPESIGLMNGWARFAKGGAYAPYYDDIHLVINWLDEGREVVAWGRGRPQNVQFFGRPGVTWPRRTTSAFSPRLLPSGCAFGDKGPAAFTNDSVSPFLLLGLLVSRPARLLLSVRLGAGDDAPGSASKSYEVGLVRDLPFPDFTQVQRSQLESLTRRAVELAIERFRFEDETSAIFAIPSIVVESRRNGAASFETLVNRVVARREDRFAELAEIGARLDTIAADALGFTLNEHAVLREELEPSVVELAGEEPVDEDLFAQAYLTKEAIAGERLPGGLEAEEDVRVLARRRQQFASLRTEETICRLFGVPPSILLELRRHLKLLRREDIEESACQVVSYAMGITFGRFELSRGVEAAETQVDPLAELLPRLLSNSNQAASASSMLMLVDDPGHAQDIVAAIRKSLASIRNEASPFEEELAGVLRPGTNDLRAWLRATFFDDHLRRYSKSRRKAPIYWQLAIPSADYSVWIYLHTFTRDTMYKVQEEVVTRKLPHEERKLELLRKEGGKNPKVEQRRALAAQELLVSELRAFVDEVRRVAPLWNPNFNDGVIINFAPLWRLVAHHKAWQRELRTTWDAICAGEHDWAHLAMHLWPERVVLKCATDRSLAIAHRLEDVFWEEGAEGRWKPRSTPTRPMEELVRERTSSAVKMALKSLLEAPVAIANGGRDRSGRRRKDTGEAV
jgi:Eco57I restriction-modification methylase